MTRLVQTMFPKPVQSTAAVLSAALVFGLGVSTAAHGLSLSIGGDRGVSVSVGTDSGVSVGASVGGDSGVSAGASVGGGSVAGVDASVGGDSGVNAGASVGGGSLLDAEVSLGGASGGGTPTQPGDGGNGPGDGGPPTTIGDVELEGVTPQQLAAAQRMRCRQDGNSTVYNGFVAFDPQGRALGVVHDTTLSRDLGFESLRIATIPRDGAASSCVMIRTSEVRLGNGAMVLPVRWDRLAQALPR